VRLFILRGLSGAEDADRVFRHLGVDDVEQASLVRVADEDEAVLLEGV
jgi:hypothetical protein